MVSLSRILTKLLLPDELASTLIFFLVSAGLELLCFLLHLLVRRSRFVLHHTVRPRAGYRVHHDVAAGGVCFVSPATRVPSLRGGRRQAQPLPSPTELPLSGWPLSAVVSASFPWGLVHHALAARLWPESHQQALPVQSWGAGRPLVVTGLYSLQRAQG